MTLMPEWLAQRASLTPGRPALACGDERLTFADLDRRAAAVAERLRRAGVKAGDRVALLAGNGVGFAAMVHAVPRAGGVLVPLNVRLAPPELAWQVADAGATLLAHDDAHAEEAERLRADGSGLRAVAVSELDGSEGAGAVASRPVPVDLAALHTIVYTSGTMGRPKGAMLTFGNHFWSAVGSALNLGLRDDDVWLACLPLFHVGGLAILLRGVIYGMPVVIHQSFDPARVNSAIDEEGVTIVSVVAAMLRRMLDARGAAPYPQSFRCALLGGGSAPAALLEECAARGVPVAATYGLTEAASQVATALPPEVLRRPGAAGKPLFPTEARIVDDEGHECARGVVGEIVVRGPTVMAGYYGLPEETARVLRDGWLRTGDAGYLDDDGYLYVLDRRDDLIISGGENVYPAEIEAALASHPDVVEAGVTGVPDERWGQVVVAAVVLRPGAAITEDDLRTHCRERLAGYKTPSRIRFVDTLPRNTIGKLLRREVRELLAALLP